MTSLRIILLIVAQIFAMASFPLCGAATECLPGWKVASGGTCLPSTYVDCGELRFCPGGFTCGVGNTCNGPHGALKDCGQGIYCASWFTCWHGNCVDERVTAICGNVLCNRGGIGHNPNHPCAKCLPNNIRLRPAPAGQLNYCDRCERFASQPSLQIHCCTCKFDNCADGCKQRYKTLLEQSNCQNKCQHSMLYECMPN